MCSFPGMSSALEFVCDHQQVPAMKSLVANGIVFVVIVMPPFLITCNSNRIEKKSHIVQPRTVREIPISGGRQSYMYCFRRASLSLIPLICSFSILTVLDAFAMNSKGISSVNKKKPQNKDFQFILLRQQS